jgi:hypothetical protein
MSLNNIQLQPQLLADLYKNSLLESGATSVPDLGTVKYLGKNQKNILVIVHQPSVPFLPDEELAFLTNILSACKLSLADIAILNSNGLPVESLENAIETEAKTVILFGIDPLSIGLPINFPFFQLQQFNKRMYLYSPSLEEIEKDKSLKMKLWNALKNLFGI